MESSAKILVTGASGMIGSALVQLLQARGHETVFRPDRSELDLRDADRVIAWFETHRPEFVFMLAARVGGIAANAADPSGFLEDNLRIILNLYDAFRRYPPRKALFPGSSCVYPRSCPQPMREDSLFTGPFEPTNEGFAFAKAIGLRMASWFERQRIADMVCPVLCNVYGTNDCFDTERSHVLSALVRRFVDAKDSGAASVTLWGSGTPRRDFLHVDDAARALVLIMDRAADSAPINVGPGSDVSIRDLAALIARLAGYAGEVRWDPSRPDGMPMKCLDISRIAFLGFEAAVGLEEGVARTITEYRARKAREVIGPKGRFAPAPKERERLV